MRVSIVGQDDGAETQRTLDGEHATGINSDLTQGVDLTLARRLTENGGASFRGDIKGGKFDIPGELVREEADAHPSLPTRLLPADEDAERELRKRTLTALYNARPAWLARRHDALDAAVYAAYGWDAGPPPGDEALLARLLALNLARGGG